METYTDKTTLAPVTVTESAAVKIMDIPRGAIGFRIYNLDATDDLLLVVRAPGDPEPSKTLIDAGKVDYRVPAQKTQDDGIRPTKNGWQLWGMYSAAPTTGVVYPIILKGPAR